MTTSTATFTDRPHKSTLRLALVHTRYNLTETIRVPMAVIGALVFPTLAFCFFVLPQREVVQSPEWAVSAVVSMVVFAVMANGLFSFGLDLANQREQSWVPYLRSLPGSPWARVAGMAAGSVVTMIAAMIPLLIVAAIFTAARPEPLAALAAIAAAIITGLPTIFLGVIIGSTLPFKGAIAVTQIAMFVLAFAGGLFLPPQMFPGWLDTASEFLPVRQAREVVIALAAGTEVPLWSVLGLVIWTVALGAVAMFLYRRDEGRRYR